jgi:hypothetical protein
MDKADASPIPPTAQQTLKSGHSMCYRNRTTSEARYRRDAPAYSTRATEATRHARPVASS